MQKREIVCIRAVLHMLHAGCSRSLAVSFSCRVRRAAYIVGSIMMPSTRISVAVPCPNANLALANVSWREVVRESQGSEKRTEESGAHRGPTDGRRCKDSSSRKSSSSLRNRTGAGSTARREVNSPATFSAASFSHANYLNRCILEAVFSRGFRDVFTRLREYEFRVCPA